MVFACRSRANHHTLCVASLKHGGLPNLTSNTEHKKSTYCCKCLIFSGPCWDRTSDHLIMSQVL